MKYTIIACFLLNLLSREALAQHYFTYGLSLGLNRNQTEIVTGDQQFQELVLPTPGFNFQYTQMLTPKVPFNASAGFGILGVKTVAAAHDAFMGDEDSPLFWTTMTVPYLRLELGSGYEVFRNNRSSYRVLGGIGIRKMSNGHYGMTSAEPVGILYKVDFESTKKSVPYLSLGAQWTYQLKNNNFLSAKLSYDYSFGNVYSGTYELYNQTSTGTFSNQGRFLALQLGYTINGQKRTERLAHLQQEQQLDRKAAKKLYRKERRYIDPHSMFIRFSGGAYLSRTTILSDPDKVMKSASCEGFMPQIAFEKGLGHNFYLEASAFSGLVWLTEKYVAMPFSSSSGSNARNLQLAVGGLYRWTLPNNYTILNFHAGLSSGVYLDALNSMGSMSNGTHTGMINNVPFSFTTQSSFYVTSRYFGALYLGASKDFRLANRVYLNLSYRHYFGINKVIVSNLTYTDNLTNKTSQVQSAVRGDGGEILIGLKVKLNQ
ncbi:MAG: hypothetical protein RLZZ301_98 [Bacteroidota bacterium]|jgi:hypothetical protein